MIFMTKDYFLQRVTCEEEMQVVQLLVDLVEDWRFCKRIVYRHRSEEAKENSRTIPKRSIYYNNTSMFDNRFRYGEGRLQVLVAVIKEQLANEGLSIERDDPFGTSMITSLDHFNKSIAPQFHSFAEESTSFVRSQQI